MEKEIQQKLSHLKQCLEKVKNLHEWKKLKDSEQKSGYPPAFQIYDSVETDLKIEVTYFVSRAMSLHRRLRRRQDQWAIVARNELIAMEREIATITSTKGL